MRIFSKISLLGLVATLCFYGCKKTSDNNVFSEYEIVDQSSKALLKINYNLAYYSNPSVQIKINGVKISGSIKTRYPFPGGGFNTGGNNTGDYLPLVPGNEDILISIPKKGSNVDSIELFKKSISIAAGKRYTLHLTDTATKSNLLVDENFARPDSGYFRFKFINLIPNIASLDLYNGTVKVASNIPFMGITGDITMPISAPTSSAWTIRVGGSSATSTAVATYSSTSTILNQRVYTVFSSGYSGFSTSGTDARKPYLSFYFVL